MNTHRAAFGLGNWDVNIILRVLGDMGYRSRWFDARRRTADCASCYASATPPAASPPHLVGFLVNERSLGVLSAVLGTRHWYAVRPIGDGVECQWWDLNSSRSAPLLLGPLSAALDALQAALDSGGHIIEIWAAGAEPLPAYDERAVAAAAAGASSASTAGVADATKTLPAVSGACGGAASVPAIGAGEAAAGAR